MSLKYLISVTKISTLLSPLAGIFNSYRVQKKRVFRVLSKTKIHSRPNIILYIIKKYSWTHARIHILLMVNIHANIPLTMFSWAELRFSYVTNFGYIQSNKIMDQVTHAVYGVTDTSLHTYWHYLSPHIYRHKLINNLQFFTSLPPVYMRRSACWECW